MFFQSPVQYKIIYGCFGHKKILRTIKYNVIQQKLKNSFYFCLSGYMCENQHSHIFQQKEFS